jgi:hypothetical protein
MIDPLDALGRPMERENRFKVYYEVDLGIGDYAEIVGVLMTKPEFGSAHDIATYGEILSYELSIDGEPVLDPVTEIKNTGVARKVAGASGDVQATFDLVNVLSATEFLAGRYGICACVNELSDDSCMDINKFTGYVGTLTVTGVYADEQFEVGQGEILEQYCDLGATMEGKSGSEKDKCKVHIWGTDDLYVGSGNDHYGGDLVFASDTPCTSLEFIDVAQLANETNNTQIAESVVELGQEGVNNLNQGYEAKITKYSYLYSAEFNIRNFIARPVPYYLCWKRLFHSGENAEEVYSAKYSMVKEHNNMFTKSRPPILGTERFDIHRAAATESCNASASFETVADPTRNYELIQGSLDTTAYGGQRTNKCSVNGTRISARERYSYVPAGLLYITGPSIPQASRKYCYSGAECKIALEGFLFSLNKSVNIDVGHYYLAQLPTAGIPAGGQLGEIGQEVKMSQYNVTAVDSLKNNFIETTKSENHDTVQIFGKMIANSGAYDLVWMPSPAAHIFK